MSKGKNLCKGISLILLTTATAFADDATWLRCREQSDPALRLACYDAVTAPVVVEPRQTPEQFGKEQQPLKQELQAIESHIEGPFRGWDPKDKLELANGQVWQISDDSKGVLNAVNPKVKVRRGILGAFYLEIEGINQSPKVKRLK